MAFLIYEAHDVYSDRDTFVTLYSFVSQARDPITGYRGWVESPMDAEWYDDPYPAHQDRLLYGGYVIKHEDLDRLGLVEAPETPAFAGFVRLEPSTVELAL